MKVSNKSQTKVEIQLKVQFLSFTFKIFNEVNLYPTCGQSAQDQQACLLCGSFKYKTSIRATSQRPQISQGDSWRSRRVRCERTVRCVGLEAALLDRSVCHRSTARAIRERTSPNALSRRTLMHKPGVIKLFCQLNPFDLNYLLEVPLRF